MAEDLQRGTGGPCPLAPGDGDESDTISLTSTAWEADPDAEYVVEAIHKEDMVMIGGESRRYVLVEWTNFPLDECSWEPFSNLSEELKRQWEAKKVTTDPNEGAEFEKKYIQARMEKLEESRQRHRRRNAKRKKLGLYRTAFWFRGQGYPDSDDERHVQEGISTGEIKAAEDEIVVEPVSSSSSDAAESEAEPPLSLSASSDSAASEEAEEDNEVDHEAADALLPVRSSSSQVKPKRRPRPNRIFTYDPDRPASKEKRPALVPGKGAPVSRTRTSNAQTHSSGSRASGQGRTDSLSRRGHEPPSSTGYKGSARTSHTAISLPSRSKEPPATKAATGATAADALAAGSTEKEKSLKAKKTSRTAVNVFTGGSKVRHRRSIADDEIDGSKGKKLFSNHNSKRKSQLRSRDRDDAAPDINKIPNELFALGSNISKETKSAQHAEASGGDNDYNTGPPVVTEENSVRSPTMPYPVSSKRSLSGSGTNPPKKKAKSVRFTGVTDEPLVSRPRSERFPGGDEIFVRETQPKSIMGDDSLFVSEPMEMDDSTGSMGDSPVLGPGSLAAVFGKTSLSAYKAEDLCTVSKKIVLSIAPAQTLDVTFDSVPKYDPRAPDQRSLNGFLDSDSLRIGHIVRADDLNSQVPSLLSLGLQALFSGSIRSTKAGRELETISVHLRLRSSALFLADKDFNLLILPSECEEFSLDTLGLSSTSSDGVALRYLVSQSRYPIHRLIRPTADVQERLHMDVGMSAGVETRVFFEDMLNMRYNHLVVGPAQHKDKFFFLAFPERSRVWLATISSWLSMRDPGCKIYTNFETGGWSAFVRKTREGCGVVILHEAVFPLVRRFPSMAQLLQGYNVNFWRFSESLDMQQIRPTRGSEVVPMIPTMFSRLFPFGKAFLITPSFLVSEPQEALRFLTWFFENQAKRSFAQLVTAYDIGDYLRDLWREKCVHREYLMHKRWNTMPAQDVATQKRTAALTNQDLKARQKTWIYIDEHLSQQSEIGDLYPGDCAIVCADRSIDPHDEQSLVNWFGWWSMACSDRCRKFYVIGSKPWMDMARAIRRVKVPKYDQSVVNDPDEAMKIVLKNRGEEVRTAHRKSHDGAQALRNNKVEGNENNIVPFLDSLPRTSRFIVYRYPVSWADTKMADHFGDHHMKCATIDQWWNFAWGWLKDPPKSFNTYIGFFYTIQEDWIPSHFRPGLRPKRHPWLAIYRPVNPHDKSMGFSHGRTELLIWDSRAGHELEEKSSLGLADLTWMQQDLVRYVQLHAHEKNPNASLERVWLGGFQRHLSQCHSAAPADATVEYLRMICDDLVRRVPGPERYIYAADYRQVSLHPAEGGAPVIRNGQGDDQSRNEDDEEQQQQGGKEEEEEEEEGGDEDPDTRIIFHPPRGSAVLQPRFASKCTNLLFDAVRVHRLQNPDRQEMLYTYTSTTEWYQHQVAEGRQFEHMVVDRWDKIFQELGIDRAEPAPKSATSEQSMSSAVDK